MTTGIAVSLQANRVTDAAGNRNVAATSSSFSYDPVPPTVTLTGWPAAAFTSQQTHAVTAVFSEAVTGSLAGGLSCAPSCSVTAVSGSGNTYSFTVNLGAAEQLYTLTLAANTMSDSAGNGNALVTRFVTLDTTAPTVTIEGFPELPMVSQSSNTLTLLFSESVTGLALTDLTCTNCMVQNLVELDAGLRYTVALEILVDGPQSVTLQANTVADRAGSGNAAQTLSGVTYDGSYPTCTFVNVPSITNQLSFTAVLRFSESVTYVNGMSSTVTCTPPGGGITCTLSSFAATSSGGFQALSFLVTVSGAGVAF